MNKIQVRMQVSLLLLIMVWATGVPATDSPEAGPIRPQPRGTSTVTKPLPVPFVANSGQISQGDVLYFANIAHGAIYVTDQSELVYGLQALAAVSPVSPHFVKSDEARSVARFAIKESLLRSERTQVFAEDPFPAKISDFRGSDPARWQTHISAYATVNLGEVYDGVVLKLKATTDNVEKLFFVQSGVDPACIRLKLEGVGGLAVGSEGELEARTSYGLITFTKPIGYQEGAMGREPVAVAYTVDGNEYGFEVGPYDRGRELVIDPLLSSTFLGGSHLEWAEDMLVDQAGNVYVAGRTASTDFPTSIGAYDTSCDAYGDVYVAKFDGDLQNLLACTYFGGSRSDQTSLIAQDANNNIFIFGRTFSSDLPITPNAFDATYEGWQNCFIAKLGNDLQTLLAATYLGGNSNTGDSASDICIDADGAVYVTGTAGLNFPATPGAYDETSNSWTDGFVAKLSNDLEQLFASTYLGGDSADVPTAIALDGDGNICIGGRTESWDFPITAGAFDASHNGGIYDAVLAKFDPNLENLLASTLLGGNGNDTILDMVADSAGNILVTGYTYSPNYPVTVSAFDTTFGGAPDAFVSKLDNGFTELLASSFLGGAGGDFGHAMDLNASGLIYVTGLTSSADFPTTAFAYDSQLGGSDAFVAKINGTLTKIGAATYLGGSSSDTGFAIALNSAGDVYVAGETWSANFPTSPGAFDGSFGGTQRDAFVTKLDHNLSDATVTGIAAELPPGFALLQNSPNPFNPITNVAFEIASEGRVTLKIYDLMGREIATLVDKNLSPGRHNARWNAARQASGMYFCELTVVPSDAKSGQVTAVRKMQLVR